MTVKAYKEFAAANRAGRLERVAHLYALPRRSRAGVAAAAARAREIAMMMPPGA
jgi:hypothetical protein